jgi:hypothetical protein
MVELYIHSPIRLHGVVLNQLSTGATLPLLKQYFENQLFTSHVEFDVAITHGSSEWSRSLGCSPTFHLQFLTPPLLCSLFGGL